MPIFAVPLPEVTAYVEALNEGLFALPGAKGLSERQKGWLTFCVTAIIVTHTLCWERFERASAGEYKAKALSFILHWTAIPWSKLLTASTLYILKLHNIKQGYLTIDDDDRPRSKSTTKIYGVHKVKDKKTGGFVMAQNLVKLVLVTPTITVPVGIEFYRPDPLLTEWSQLDKKLKAEKAPKDKRPKKPARRKEYPTKQAIAAKLLRRFRYMAGFLDIHAILADAAYMSKFFRAECSRVYPGVQVISQLKLSQICWDSSGKHRSLKEYFAAKPLQEVVVERRGSDKVSIQYTSARLCIKRYGQHPMLIVPMKYDEEKEALRYIVATNPTWCSLAVVKAYAFRWLVEVVIEDWKLYEGWGMYAYQQGEDGARRGLCLSLLVDHFLLQHPVQLHLARAGQPLKTVGTLMRKLQVNCLLALIAGILDCDDPQAALQQLANQLDEVVQLRSSDKHMSGRSLEDLGPSPSLVKRFGAAQS